MRGVFHLPPLTLRSPSNWLSAKDCGPHGPRKYGVVRCGAVLAAWVGLYPEGEDGRSRGLRAYSCSHLGGTLEPSVIYMSRELNSGKKLEKPLELLE